MATSTIISFKRSNYDDELRRLRLFLRYRLRIEGFLHISINIKYKVIMV